MAINECLKCGFEYGIAMVDESDPYAQYKKRMDEYNKRSDGYEDDDLKPSKPDPNSKRILKVWTREVDDDFNAIYTCPNCGYENKVPLDEESPLDED